MKLWKGVTAAMVLAGTAKVVSIAISAAVGGAVGGAAGRIVGEETAKARMEVRQADYRAHIEEHLPEVAAATNSVEHLPRVKKDGEESVRIDEVVAGDHVLNVRSTWLDFTSEQLRAGEFDSARYLQYAKPKARAALCADNAAQNILAHGVRYHYVFHSSDGEPFVTFDVTSADCAAVS